MWDRPRKESGEAVRVQCPHAGQRFVDAKELLSNKEVQEQIESMATLAEESAPRSGEEPDDS